MLFITLVFLMTQPNLLSHIPIFLFFQAKFLWNTRNLFILLHFDEWVYFFLPRSNHLWSLHGLRWLDIHRLCNLYTVWLAHFIQILITMSQHFIYLVCTLFIFFLQGLNCRSISEITLRCRCDEKLSLRGGFMLLKLRCTRWTWSVIGTVLRPSLWLSWIEETIVQRNVMRKLLRILLLDGHQTAFLIFRVFLQFNCLRGFESLSFRRSLQCISRLIRYHAVPICF